MGEVVFYCTKRLFCLPIVRAIRFPSAGGPVHLLQVHVLEKSARVHRYSNTDRHLSTDALHTWPGMKVMRTAEGKRLSPAPHWPPGGLAAATPSSPLREETINGILSVRCHALKKDTGYFWNTNKLKALVA